MSLRHAILVLLQDEPASGYDLVRHFRAGIGHFWQATHQQVYQELKKLHADKLVQFEVESQEERPDKKVYRLTAAGRRVLREWLAQPVKPLRIRDALLIKVYGGEAADRVALIAELTRHEAMQRRQLQEYRELEQLYFSQDDTGRRRFRLPYLTLRRGIRYVQDLLAWLAEARELLEQDRLPEAPVPASPAERAPKIAKSVTAAKRRAGSA